MGRALLLIFGVLVTLGLARGIAKNPPNLGTLLPRSTTSTFALPQTPEQPIPVIRGGGTQLRPVQPPSQPTPTPAAGGPPPETFITASPQAGSTQEAPEITFRFSGQDPLGKRVSFETFIAGIDQNWGWQGSGGERKVRFPGGEKVWTFQVRARSEDGRVDPSPASVTFRLRLSPSLDKIRISSVTRPSGTIFGGTQGAEAVTISAWGLSQQEKPVTITGWKIITEENAATIGQGVAIYYGDSRDVVGSVALRSGEQAVVIRGQSPLGAGFRINKCFGWLAKIYQFQPTIFSSCPTIPDAKLVGITGACREAVRFAANSCSVPDLEKAGLSTKAECVAWVNQNLNYGACVREHRDDSDFLQNEWRLYAPFSTTFVDAQHDTVTLRDQNGLFVDQFTY